MAISNSDIVEYASDAALSAGGGLTATAIPSGVRNNVWPEILNSDRVAGGTLYRKTFWKNNNGTDSALIPLLYTPVLPTPSCTLKVGLGPNDSLDTDPTQGNMTAWGASAKVALISDGADVRVVTIYGLDNSGSPVPVSETVTLTGAVEVLSVNTYSVVYANWLSAQSGTRTVTVKQGTGGTTRGVVGPNKSSCWLWLVAGPTSGSAIQTPDLAAGQVIGVWRQLSWLPAAAVSRPDSLSVRFQEGS